jgi:Zn-dependent protease with chaperone function
VTTPRDLGVLRASGDAVHPWLLCLPLGAIPAVAAPLRWQPTVAAALCGLALLPAVGPPWRAWTAATRWLGGWTTVSESVATVPSPVGVPGVEGSATETLRQVGEGADLELLLDRGAGEGEHHPIVGTWLADDTPVRYVWTFAESVESVGPDGRETTVTTVTQRVALPRAVHLTQKFALRAILLGIVVGGLVLVEGGVTVAALAPPGEPVGTPPALGSEAASSVLSLGLLGLGAGLMVAVYGVAIGPTWLRLLRRPNPLRELKRADHADVADSVTGPAAGYRHLTVDFDMLLAAPATACLAVGFFTGRPRLAVAAAALLALAATVSGAALVDGRPHLWLRRALADVVGGTPLAGRYVELVGAAAVPLGTIGLLGLVLRATVGAVSLPGAWRWLDLGPAVSFLLFTGGVLVAIHDEAAPAGRFTARQKRTTPATLAVGVAVVAACSLVTYAGLAFAVDLWLLDPGFVGGPVPALRWSSATATLLFLAVPAGAVAGSLWDLAGRTGPPADAERLTGSLADAVDAPVYLRETEDLVTEAVAPLRGPSYVLLSTGTLDHVEDPGQRRALLAHEQAHIDHGDATLGLVIPVAGVLTLTGRNVLFDLFDVPEREHRADLAAAHSDVATPADVVAVLDRLDDLEERLDAGRAAAGAFGAAATPFRPTDSRSGALPAPLARAFALFFGTFALTAVHPTLVRRRARVHGECDLADAGDRPAGSDRSSAGG